MHHSQYIFFSFAIFVHTLINVYVFYRSKQALPKSKNIRTIFTLVYLFFFLAFIIAMLGRNFFPLIIQKMLYIPGTLWLGMMLYLLMFFLLSDLIFFVIHIFHRMSPTIKHNYHKVQVLSGYILVLCLTIYGNYQFKHPKVIEQNISIAKKAGDYKNLRIVGVSDLHLGVANDRKRLEQYVRLINDQHPDLIIIAGDLIDNNVLPLEKEQMWETLNKLKAPLGTYFCIGNHEYMIGIEACMNFLRKTNMHLLIDKSVLIDESIQIIGRDDKQRSHNRKSMKELVKDLDTNLPLILIDHEPYYLNEAEKNGIDLQFSGHTHRGQIFPGNLLADRLYELSYGYEQRGNTHYYISSGLGLWGPPLRIGTQSEVIVFNIKFN